MRRFLQRSIICGRQVTCSGRTVTCSRTTTTNHVVEETGEEEEVFPDNPDQFHVRHLQVHEAFRRYRPPREVWLHNVYDHRSKRGILELHPAVFAANPRIDHIHETIAWQNACTQEDVMEYSRAELPGTGNKQSRQKGQGRARRKGERAPNFIEGGKAHPKRPYDYGYDLDHEILLSAFSAILTTKLAQSDLYIVDSLAHIEIPHLLQFQEGINSESVLFVAGMGGGLSTSQHTQICFHPGIDLLTSETIHPKAMLQYITLVLDYEAVQDLEHWALTMGKEHELSEELVTRYK